MNILNTYKKYFTNSKIGIIIRRLFLSLALTMTIVFITGFILYTRMLMRNNGTKQMNDITAQCSKEIELTMDNYIKLAQYTSQILSLSKNDSISREATMLLLKNAFINAENFIMMGMKWDKNAFDHRDAKFQNSNLFESYNGEFNCYFYRNKDGEVLNDNGFKFENSIYEEICKNPIPKAFSPEFITINGKKTLAFPFAVPILDIKTNKENQHKMLGALISYISLKSFAEIAKKYNDSISFQTNAIIFDNNKKIIANTETEGSEGKNIEELYTNFSNNPELFNQKKSQFKIDDYSFHSTFLNIGNNETKWLIVFKTASNNFTNGIGQLIKSLAIICIVLFSLAFILSTFVGYSIGRPISAMLIGCKQLASGNLNVSFKQKYIGKDEISQLFIAFNDMAEKLKKIVMDVKQSAQNVNSAGRELSKSASLMASGANEQASASEQVSSAMEEMTSSIQKNATNANQTEIITNKVVQSVLIANKSVGKTVDAMKNITNKIGIINEIVGRTDLLAVNAAIEAARVGELGKGFAVVASEIRKLAEKSQIAAKEIDELTINGVKQAENSGNLLDLLVPEINKTSQLIHEITASTVEQNSNASQVNNALQQLNSITQQNAATAEELSTSADESQSQAESLDNTMSFFRFEKITDESEISLLNKQATEILKQIDKKISK
ncbi:MAG: methyl-accepting chemotaxis protein [Bacteroidales bacterium]|nr:methyl-accepting chemotaxis protein [Bacteroidales bacterium]